MKGHRVEEERAIGADLIPEKGARVNYDWGRREEINTSYAIVK